MVLFANRKYLGLENQQNGQARRVNIPSPSGGLNTRDAQSAMDATDAVIMENWFPGQGSVSTRKGFTEYTASLTGVVETLAEFNAGTSRKFISANADEINDITHLVSIVNIVSGFSNARRQIANFNADMFHFNGAVTPQSDNGSTLTACTKIASG